MGLWNLQVPGRHCGVAAPASTFDNNHSGIEGYSAGMKAKRETLERIEEVVRAMEELSSEELSTWQEPWGFRKMIAVPNAAVADDQQGTGWLFSGGRAGELYLKALDSLETDPAFENLARADLDNELKDLLRDLVVTREQMKTSSEIRKRATAFLDKLARPLGKYEVAFGVERMNLGSGSLTVGDVVFQKFSAELARDWNYSEIPDGSREFLDDLVNQTIGIVTVNAGSPRKAVERAVAVLDRALNTLRVCVVFSNPVRISDRWLLQRRGELHAVRQVDPKTRPVEWGVARGFRPVSLDLSAPWTESTKDFIGRLGPLYDGTIQGKLRDALLRSLEWIGMSITRESYDHKIVDLCAGLEAVLTTVDDRRKGEAIAFRFMLLSAALGKPFCPPGVLYDLYERRSRVVHGAALGECGENDYLQLRLVAKEAVLNVIELNRLQGPIDRPSRLIGLLESHDRKEEAMAWLEGCRDNATGKVNKYAKSRCSPSGAVE